MCCSSTTIALLIAIILPIITFFIFFGIKIRNKNNAFGLLLLFIPLNVIGLLIGFYILYNLKQKKEEQKLFNDKLYKIIDKFEKKLDKELNEKDKTPQS